MQLRTRVRCLTPQAPLPQQRFEWAGVRVGHVGGGDEVSPQQVGQHLGVDPVGLDLGFGNDTGLVRMDYYP